MTLSCKKTILTSAAVIMLTLGFGLQGASAAPKPVILAPITVEDKDPCVDFEDGTWTNMRCVPPGGNVVCNIYVCERKKTDKDKSYLNKTVTEERCLKEACDRGDKSACLKKDKKQSLTCSNKTPILVRPVSVLDVTNR